MSETNEQGHEATLQAPATKPPLIRAGDWTAFSCLAAGGPTPTTAVAIIDKPGDLWLTNRETPDVGLRIPIGEALQLTQFLAEHFGLVVVNEPEAFGNDQHRCECPKVPLRLRCMACDIDLHTSDGFGDRAEWETDRAKEATHA